LGVVFCYCCKQQQRISFSTVQLRAVVVESIPSVETTQKVRKEMKRTVKRQGVLFVARPLRQRDGALPITGEKIYVISGARLL
jgi:hypothetical protein